MCKICKLFSGGNFTTPTNSSVTLKTPARVILNGVKNLKTSTKTFLSLMLITTAFASCTNESEDIKPQQGTPLQLNVKTATIQSRGLIESATLPDGSQIGITLAGDVYSEYDNTVFTASTVNGKQQWNSTKEVLLTSEESVLFSYYPWKEGTDYNAIEIETASQTDYMYGTPVESVSEDNPNPTITLNHALANINLTFVKGTYVGEGNVTEVSVHGDGIATGGTFDASITQSYIPGEPLTGIGDKVTVTTATELDGDAVNIMVVPVNASKSFTVTATIDGVDYTISTSAVQLEMGSSYKYTLTLNSTMMGVSEVAVTQWNPVTKDNLIPRKS